MTVLPLHLNHLLKFPPLPDGSPSVLIDTTADVASRESELFPRCNHLAIAPRPRVGLVHLLVHCGQGHV